MNQTMTAGQSLSQIASHAEAIKNDEHQVAGEMSVGDAFAQGDISLVLLEKVPEGCTLVESPMLQLAPGTTQGSRHCLESLEGISIYQLPKPNELEGPVIDAQKGCRVNHPEHGDVTFRMGIYGVVYQRQYAEEIRRVQD